MTLDMQKSWSWASNRALIENLKHDDLPQPVTSANNLGSFFRYVDEQQTNVLSATRYEDATYRLRQLSKVHLPLSDKINLALSSVLTKWGYSCETQMLDWKELHNLQRTIVDSVWKLPSIGSPTVFFAWPSPCVTRYYGPSANHTELENHVLLSFYLTWRSFVSLEPLGRKENPNWETP